MEYIDHLILIALYSEKVTMICISLPVQVRALIAIICINKQMYWGAHWFIDTEAATVGRSPGGYYQRSIIMYMECYSYKIF